MIAKENNSQQEKKNVMQDNMNNLFECNYILLVYWQIINNTCYFSNSICPETI